MKPGASFKRASPANRAHVNSPLNYGAYVKNPTLYKICLRPRSNVALLMRQTSYNSCITQERRLA